MATMKKASKSSAKTEEVKQLYFVELRDLNLDNSDDAELEGIISLTKTAAKLLNKKLSDFEAKYGGHSDFNWDFIVQPISKHFGKVSTKDITQVLDRISENHPAEHVQEEAPSFRSRSGC